MIKGAAQTMHTYMQHYPTYIHANRQQRHNSWQPGFEGLCVCICVCVYACVRVCVGERARKREWVRVHAGSSLILHYTTHSYVSRCVILTIKFLKTDLNRYIHTHVYHARKLACSHTHIIISLSHTHTCTRTHTHTHTQTHVNAQAYIHMQTYAPPPDTLARKHTPTHRSTLFLCTQIHVMTSDGHYHQNQGPYEPLYCH